MIKKEKEKKEEEEKKKAKKEAKADQVDGGVDARHEPVEEPGVEGLGQGITRLVGLLASEGLG